MKLKTASPEFFSEPENLYELYKLDKEILLMSDPESLADKCKALENLTNVDPEQYAAEAYEIFQEGNVLSRLAIKEGYYGVGYILARSVARSADDLLREYDYIDRDMIKESQEKAAHLILSIAARLNKKGWQELGEEALQAANDWSEEGGRVNKASREQILKNMHRKAAVFPVGERPVLQNRLLNRQPKPFLLTAEI